MKVRFGCCENVSFGSGVISKTFRCFVVSSILLFDISNKVVPYSNEPGAKSVVVVLFVFI